MDFIKKENCALSVVDIQERFMPAIPEEPRGRMIKNTQILIETAKTLGIPILITEQYPKGLGTTIEVIADTIGDGVKPIEKLHFSCARSEYYKAQLKETGRKEVILCGIETHVCVLQTAIDLINDGYRVYIPADAVYSRRELDWEIGLKTAEKAGVLIGTTETFVFQLLEKAGTDEFKRVSKLLR